MYLLAKIYQNINFPLNFENIDYRKSDLEALTCTDPDPATSCYTICKICTNTSIAKVASLKIINSAFLC